MTQAFFVSDLHGRVDRYRKLFAAIEAERPAAVFLGGDLLPSGLFSAIGLPEGDHFIRDFLVGELSRLRATLNENYPRRGSPDPGSRGFGSVGICPRAAAGTPRLRRVRVRLRPAYPVPTQGLGTL